MTDPWARPPAPGDPDDSGQPPPPGYGPPGESTPGPALPPDAAPPPDAGAFPPPPPPPPGYGAPGAVPPPEAGAFPPPPPPPGYGPPSYPIDQDPAALPPPPHAGPPAAPPGYGPPPYPGYGPPGYGPPPRPYDPLVAYDFSSWFDRLKGVVARSWKGIVQLTLLGYVLPVMLLTVVVVAVGWGGIFAMVTALNQRSDTTEPGAGSDVALPILGLLFLLIVVVAVVAGYLNAVTSLSIVKVATNDAVETPVGPVDAYRSSLRLGWPTLGWAMLAGLAVGIGWVLCCLPGIYLMVALSLIVPIMAFERQGGFAGSLKLTHTNFWPTAGRVLLLFLVVMAATYAANIVLSIATLPFTPSDQSGEVSGTMVVLFVLANIVKFVVVQMVSIAGQMLLLSGYLVTYAELRGRLQPELSARHLAAEVNA